MENNEAGIARPAQEAIVHWADINFTVVVTADDGPDRASCVHFTAHRIFGWDTENRPCWHHKNNQMSSPHPTEALGEAKVAFSGSVRFDGCINWVADEQAFDRVVVKYSHGCSWEDAGAIGDLLTRVHDIAGHLMPANRDFTPVLSPEQLGFVQESASEQEVT